ncbi:MAG TPA: response regulator [Terriglobales bacterium]|nr:response regulator [Terriglobales bacterium]
MARTRILVVDDERVIATTLSAILQQRGYETATAFDGPSAIATAIAFNPHLVLSDVVMPGMSGVEAAMQILGKLPNCKVLFFSGQANSLDFLQSAREQGFDFEILAKPVHPETLLKIVGRNVATGEESQVAIRKVLVVDDDERQRYFVAHVLRRHGFEVVEAANGQEALRSAAEKPNLIILDLNLPDVNGFEVCRRLKASPETRDIPIIHLTSTYRDEESKLRSLSSGAAQYLTHPVEPDDLFATLDAVLSSKK